MESISRWKSCPAFLRPKGVCGKRKRPNGVMTAVLHTSSGATGIWWYPLTRSILENTVFPWRLALKSARVRTGYLSSFVIALTRRKSPQTRQPPHGVVGVHVHGLTHGFLATMRGDAHSDLPLWQIPNLTNLSISSLATLSFSGSRRRARDCAGRPSVGIWWSTPCLA